MFVCPKEMDLKQSIDLVRVASDLDSVFQTCTQVSVYMCVCVCVQFQCKMCLTAVIGMELRQSPGVGGL